MLTTPPRQTFYPEKANPSKLFDDCDNSKESDSQRKNVLSKETKLRRRINRIYRKTITKSRARKDGYRWLAHNRLRYGYILKEIFPLKEVQNPIRRNLLSRICIGLEGLYGAFDPSKNLSEINQKAYPEPLIAQPPSLRERYLAQIYAQTKTHQLSHELLMELEYLRIVRLDGKIESPESTYKTPLTQQELALVKKPTDVIHFTPLANDLQPPVMSVDPWQVPDFTVKQAPSPVFEQPHVGFYDSLVSQGFIQPGDPLPEDPPEGWEPSDDLTSFSFTNDTLMLDESQYASEQLRDSDFENKAF